MPRLIDAEKLKAYLQENYIMYDHTLADIDAQPTVDAVEVVRCKDCKYWNNKYCCDFMIIDSDGFCAWGERREDAVVHNQT